MQILACINRFLLDLEDGIFTLKKVEPNDVGLMNVINARKEQFVNVFVEETEIEDIEYALKVSNFLIMLYQFKRKFSHYFSFILEDFLRLNFFKTNDVLSFINEKYKQMALLSAEDYKKRFGKLNLSPEEAHQATLEWAGGF